MSRKALLLTLAVVSGMGGASAALAGVAVSTSPINPHDYAYRPENRCNCVLYARTFRPLPSGLTTLKGKLEAINSHTCGKNRAAVMDVGDVGHVGIVEQCDRSGSHQSLTLVEANYRSCQLTRRTARGSKIKDVEKKLRIVGYRK